MSMNEFRRLAARMDQQMQQLAAEGVSEAHAVLNRMMGHLPDLHRIWVSTSDQQRYNFIGTFYFIKNSFKIIRLQLESRLLCAGVESKPLMTIDQLHRRSPCAHRYRH